MRVRAHVYDGLCTSENVLENFSSFFFARYPRPYARYNILRSRLMGALVRDVARTREREKNVSQCCFPLSKNSHIVTGTE